MPSVEDDIFLVRELLAWAGTNPSRAARRIGVANTTLNRFANGSARSRIGRDTLDKLRAAYPDFPGFRPDPDIASGAAVADPVPVRAATLDMVTIDGQRIEAARLTDRSIETLPAGPVSRRHPDTLACHVQGSSMHPALREGELIAIASAAALSAGDLVAVWLVPDPEAAGDVVLLKELVRRSVDAIELREYDPARSFTVDHARVLRIDRILSRGDLLRDPG